MRYLAETPASSRVYAEAPIHYQYFSDTHISSAPSSTQYVKDTPPPSEKDYAGLYIGITAAALGATLVTIGFCMHTYIKYRSLMRRIRV